MLYCEGGMCLRDIMAAAVIETTFGDDCKPDLMTRENQTVGGRQTRTKEGGSMDDRLTSRAIQHQRRVDTELRRNCTRHPIHSRIGAVCQN